VGLDLVDVHRLGQLGKVVLPEISKSYAVRQSIAKQVSDRLCQEGLPAVPSGEESRQARNDGTNIVAADYLNSACV
jgi:hypothetical protein